MHHMYGPDTPTPTFSDWVGMPGTPGASDHPWLSTGDASDSIAAFEREIDDAFDLNFDALDPTRFLCQSSMEFDWQPEFHDASPSASTPDSFMDGLSSSAYTVNGPLSPISEMTLVNSPTAAVLPELKPDPTQGPLVGHQFAPFPPPLMDAGFTCQYQPWSTTSPASVRTSMTMGYPNHDHRNGGQHWPEQPLSQYEIDPARAVVTGLVAGVGLSMDSPALASVDHALPLHSPSAEVQQDALVISGEQNRTKRSRDVTNDNSASHKDGAPRKRKRSKQSTKQFPCPKCPRVFTRSNNLKQHISSYHLGERNYGCMVLGCGRTYSRNFDLKKHLWSEHKIQAPPLTRSQKDGMVVKVQKATKSKLKEPVMQGV